MGVELHGKTLGVVGCGRIGQVNATLLLLSLLFSFSFLFLFIYISTQLSWCIRTSFISENSIWLSSLLLCLFCCATVLFPFTSCSIVLLLQSTIRYGLESRSRIQIQSTSLMNFTSQLMCYLSQTLSLHPSLNRSLTHSITHSITHSLSLLLTPYLLLTS